MRSGRRLIKTSEQDPGRWVTEEDKISQYVAKGVHFIDITDIEDEDILKRLSTRPQLQTTNGQTLGPFVVTYPSSASHRSEANGLVAKVNITDQQEWLKNMTSFYNRYYRSSYGTEAATWLFNTVKVAASGNPEIVVTQFIHTSFNQPSIIARIPGTSSNLIIAGAHFDSTGGSTTARGPGADDNGSGVIVTLEALRVFATSRVKPHNTLEFHFYAAEEPGLLGSQAIFAHYKSSKKTVLAMLNQDMAGYSPSGKISVFEDYSDPALVHFVKKMIRVYAGGDSDSDGHGSYTTDKCGYACSDHASAYINGFPAAYVCDEPQRTSDPYIHSSKDTYETIDWTTVARHTKFTIGFLVEASYI